MSRELGRRFISVDGLLILGVAVIEVVNLLLLGVTNPLAYALLVGAAAVLLAHQKAPRIVLLITSALVFTYLLQVGPDVIAVVPVLLAVYVATSAGHRLLAALASLVFVVGALLSGPIREGILSIGWFVAAGVMGHLARARVAYLEQVERRAAEAERTREVEARRRAADERLRIARDLHDSLTHTISVIKVQAGVAVHLARKRGEEVPPALLTIQEASTEAMRELRATLGVLRAETVDDGVDRAGVVRERSVDERETAVANGETGGLSRLDDLTARIRSTGLPVHLTIDGPQRRLPPETDSTAYRIVQEALTNVTRHAGPASASVLISYGPDTLTVQVDDDGVASPANPPVPGVGLLGMRERATAAGGYLSAAPRPDGGFRVHAELPLKPAVLNGSDR